MNTAAERVNKGVSYLDKTFGRDNWLGKVNVDAIDLGLQEKCVIGQVTGSFFQHADQVLGVNNVCMNTWDSNDDKKVKMVREFFHPRGFVTAQAIYSFAGMTEAAELTNAWKKKITNLKKRTFVLSPIQKQNIHENIV